MAPIKPHFLARKPHVPPTPPAEDASHRAATGGGAGVLDLLSIPAALVRWNKGVFVLEAVNRSFRRHGLGTDAENSPLVALLGARIAAFLGSKESREELSWQCGEAVDCRHYRVTLARRDRRSSAGRCLVTLVDETAELRTQENLRREMLTDALTGLPNRSGFTDRLESVVGNDPLTRSGYAVLIIDLDRFSRVNACLGALAADELLISVARRLKGALRGRDVLARTGGDEFGVLLTLEDGRGDALHAAKRIQGALTTPFRLADFEIRIACSIGIAYGEDTAEDIEELVRHAQFAMKRSKKSGRAEAYQTQAFDIAREQFSLETALRRAIEGGLMRLTFQPICDLSSGKITSFEALARWTDENGVAHSPNEFIPVAEECGLIVPLGRWAMAEAARTLASWDKRAGESADIKIAVNLSAIQLARDSVTPMVEQTISAHGLTPDRFVLELTESALISDPDRIARTMHALKALGTTLAMDDFGTGYSNLAYLQKLPIDILKIDRSFVTGMLADRDKIAIVRAILSLAQALGMKTTAEGIETIELAQTLAALGCSFGQGFFYARGLESSEAYALLEARNQVPTASSAS